MSFQVLARRYRPRRFDEVVGQESIAETLRAGILQDRVAHAYLFTGPRGVGKTSMARIFAKALNCRTAAEAEGDARGVPCDECEICEGIHIGQDIDVVEMDGASHRGIEDVRAIIESVGRPATRSPYKIFIIDEVHMLTREAFNALLKTLEEPPAHVKFIFATTEAHRIPDTVLSRCQRFDFHPITDEAIVRRLAQIAAAEKRECEDGVLEKIAACSRGGLRDAQTLLDQLLTFSEEILRAEDLERVTGRVSDGLVGSLAEAVIEGDHAGVLGVLGECQSAGADPAVLLDQVIEGFRERLHAAGGESGAEARIDRLLGVLQICLETARQLRYSAHPTIAVEVVLLKAARLEDPLALDQVIAKLAELEASGIADAPAPRAGRARAEPTGDAFTAPRARRDVESGGRRPSEPPSDSPSARDSARPDVTESGTAMEARAGIAVTLEEPAGDAVPPARTVAESLTAVVGTEAPDAAPAAARESSVPDAAPSGRSRAAKFDFERLSGLWNQITIELEEHHPSIAPLIAGAALRPGRRSDLVRLEFAEDFFLQRMQSPGNKNALERLVADVTGDAWALELVRGSGESASPRAEAAVKRERRTAEPSDDRDAAARGGNDAASAAAESDAAATRDPDTSERIPSGEEPAGRLAERPLVGKAKKLFKGRIV